MENKIQSKMPIIELNVLFLRKINESVILNLSFSNYRSFKGECSFTTEPTASKAKTNNLCENPEYKTMLSELLAFADTGMKDFQLEKRSDGPEVNSLHTIYDNGEVDGQTDLALKDESFGTRGLFVIGCHILRSLHSGTPFFCGWDWFRFAYLYYHPHRWYVPQQANQQIWVTVDFHYHDVNQLNSELVRKDQVWFVEKDEYGKSELFSLSDFEDVREDTPFDKWYMNNKFGGVPTLKSLENLFSDGKE